MKPLTSITNKIFTRAIVCLRVVVLLAAGTLLGSLAGMWAWESIVLMVKMMRGN